MRALRALKRVAKSPFVFVSERGAPFTVGGLQKLVERTGKTAKIGFKVHPHMLRHATGFVLARLATGGYVGLTPPLLAGAARKICRHLLAVSPHG